MPPADPAVHDATAVLPDVRLHYLEAGSGPLVVLLHGFPDFSYGWHRQIGPLVAAGFRVVVPDLRGYNLSSRPTGIENYTLQKLAGDVAALIAERGESSAHVAGHDWGGIVAWGVAAYHPDVVERLAVLNIPHPRRMRQGLRTWRQLRKSWYTIAFQIPRLPERVMAAGGFRVLRRAIEEDAAPGAIGPGDVERYVHAWRRPGALTAMVAYYRAAVRHPALRFPTVTAPTLVVWGDNDHYLGVELAEPDRRDVPNLRSVVHLPGASHWVMRDEPERVAQLLGDFFAGADDPS